MTDAVVKVLFQYEALPDPKTTIRLLTISPGSGPVQCSMTTSPIEPSAYSCLSYTWGDDTKLRRIYINGGRYSVRKNLLAFLHTARRYGLVEPIWIDAICINQDDNFEKSSQVRMMGNIYYSASRVIVWLGCRLPDDHLMELMQLQDVLLGRAPQCWCGPKDTISRRKMILGLGREILRNAGDKVEHNCHCGSQFTKDASMWLLRNWTWRRLPVHERCRLFFESMNEVLPGKIYTHPVLQAALRAWRGCFNVDSALKRLAKAPYWRRVWILQEIALARNVEILTLSGSLQVNILVDLINLQDYKSGSFDPALVALRGYISGYNDEDYKEAINTRTQERYTRDFYDLLQATRERQCHDSRDRIFAIISLTSSGKLFEVDYTISELELYSRCLQHQDRDITESHGPQKGFVRVCKRLTAGYLYEMLCLKPPIDEDIVELSTVVGTVPQITSSETEFISFWASIERTDDHFDSTPFALCTRFRNAGNTWLLVYPCDSEGMDTGNEALWQLIHGKWKRCCVLRYAPNTLFGKCHANCKCGQQGQIVGMRSWLEEWLSF